MIRNGSIAWNHLYIYTQLFPRISRFYLKIHKDFISVCYAVRVEEKYTKNYTDWFQIKEKLEGNSYLPVVMNGDIWSLHVGINLGMEIDGKGEGFIRPVYVFKRLSKHAFIGIPLSRKGDSHYKYEIDDTGSFLVFSQIKSFSVKRCISFVTNLTRVQQDKVYQEFNKFVLK